MGANFTQICCQERTAELRGKTLVDRINGMFASGRWKNWLAH